MNLTRILLTLQSVQVISSVRSETPFFAVSVARNVTLSLSKGGWLLLRQAQGDCLNDSF